MKNTLRTTMELIKEALEDSSISDSKFRLIVSLLINDEKPSDEDMNWAKKQLDQYKKQKNK